MKPKNRRILVIDDLPSIHEDYRKILGAGGGGASSLDQTEAEIFGELSRPEKTLGFQIDSAFQGQEGLGKVRATLEEGCPYAMAFVDIRMPPGWDGIETIGHLWEADPALHVVVCSAYSDYSWDDMVAKLGWSDRLLILKKPFDAVEVRQVAFAVTEKWNLARALDVHLANLEGLVQERTRELEQSLSLVRESEERFRLMADTAPVMVWVADAEGNCTYCNKTWLELTGRRLEEELGGGWAGGIHPEDAERCLADIQKCVSERSKFRMECRVRSATGGYRWVFATGVPRFLPDGTFSGYIGSAVDLTERMDLEAQLRQSQKMESVGQLAGGVAHDFNNILTVIQGHASLLAASEQAPPEFRDSARQITLAAERAANLTAQLLTFGRRQMLQPKVLDLNEVVAGTTRLLQRVLGEHITLDIRKAPDLPGVHADLNMLEQILLNLAVNSRDAMPGGGRLSISLSAARIGASDLERNAEAVAGNHVCLTVSDNGCGIPKEHSSKIFEPFFTTKALGKGSGLGLATVYGIVKQHRGWIELESEEQTGTTFRIYLPASTRPALPSRPVLEPAQSRLPGGTETILVVEDEALVRRLVVNLLKRLGYTVHEAASGPEAIVLGQKINYQVDLLLTDVVMPDGMTGKDLAERLVAINSRLAVVFTSGYSADIISENFVLTTENFLQKPYEPRKLAQTVRQSLDAAAKS